MSRLRFCHLFVDRLFVGIQSLVSGFATGRHLRGGYALSLSHSAALAYGELLSIGTALRQHIEDMKRTRCDFGSEQNDGRLTSLLRMQVGKKRSLNCKLLAVYPRNPGIENADYVVVGS